MGIINPSVDYAMLSLVAVCYYIVSYGMLLLVILMNSVLTSLSSHL